jgi:O-6-methylguanine DNA methyltransferase
MHTVAGPWGPLRVAASADGIVAAEWSPTREAFETRLRARFGVRIDAVADSDADTDADTMLGSVLPLIERLVAGDPVDVTDVAIDLSDRPTFDRRVLAAVREVPWGQTASYGEIARRVGAPRAARAVGGAVGRNPLALLVPCHRIIAADGSLGGYGGDGATERAEALQRKRELLRREGLTVPSRTG